VPSLSFSECEAQSLAWDHSPSRRRKSLFSKRELGFFPRGLWEADSSRDLREGGREGEREAGSVGTRPSWPQMVIFKWSGWCWWKRLAHFFPDSRTEEGLGLGAESPRRIWADAWEKL
jgi:hypothetical protein